MEKMERKGTNQYSSQIDRTANNSQSIVIQEDSKGVTSTHLEAMAVAMSFMYKRELSRVSNGHYKLTKFEFWSTFFIVVTFTILVLAGMWGVNPITYYVSHWRELVLFTIAIPILLVILIQLSLTLRWVLYWIALTAGLLFILYDKINARNYAAVGKIVLIAFLSVEFVTLLIYFLQRVILVKYAISIISKDPQRFFQVKETSGYTNRYHFKHLLSVGKPKSFTYVGETNSDGLPDGLGHWHSHWKFGEVLEGYFKNGNPIGPFVSREFATGYSFKNVRVGYISSVKPFNSNTLQRGMQLRYGVVGVECSISGRFFTDLPNAERLKGTFKDVSQVLESLDVYFDQPKKDRVTVECGGKGLLINGYDPIASSNNVNISIDSNSPSLKIEGWRKQDGKCEALLFIPGYNSTLEQSLISLGQLICLGSLSHRIKPFVFCWPGGKLINYLSAVKVAQSEGVGRDLIQAIQELKAAGITKLHIICHSLGARVLMNTTAAFAELFHDKSETLNTKGLIELVSITLINPELSLPLFVNLRFDIIHQFSNLITIYGNSSDVALKVAEVVNWDKMVGCRPLDLYRDSTNESLEYLDLDVVDTTDLETNVHVAKHCYFNLNKAIVDDVIEIISKRQRASERGHRLLHIKGNCSTILQAPAYVTN